MAGFQSVKVNNLEYGGTWVWIDNSHNPSYKKDGRAKFEDWGAQQQKKRSPFINGKKGIWEENKHAIAAGWIVVVSRTLIKARDKERG